MGLWTNLGSHMTVSDVPRCLAGCRNERWVKRAIILTVRNPYDYWWSLYQHQPMNTCLGIGLRRSSSSSSLTCSPTSVNKLMPLAHQAGGNASFDVFLHSINRSTAGFQATVLQSESINRICGNPCDDQFLLRTETLNADFLSLLGKLNLPVLQGLPPEQPPYDTVTLAAVAVDSGSDASASAVIGASKANNNRRAQVYTPKMAALVQEMEGLLFDHFGYSREL
eukprot:scaffold14832_cov129-Isochrysis_galbana.AAC.7